MAEVAEHPLPMRAIPLALASAQSRSAHPHRRQSPVNDCLSKRHEK